MWHDNSVHSKGENERKVYIVRHLEISHMRRGLTALFYLRNMLSKANNTLLKQLETVTQCNVCIVLANSSTGCLKCRCAIKPLLEALKVASKSAFDVT